MMRLVVVLAVVATLGPVNGINNGLGRTPAMGYNSWYDLMCSITEDLMHETIEAFAAKFPASLGYEYINLDDCWAGGRYPNGTVYTEASTFPSGTLIPLVQHANKLGYKLGTYTDRGTETCAGRPGSSADYIEIDANTYAEWGIEYVKEDSCHASTNHSVAFQEYGAMAKALNQTGKPILFSLCGWNSWYAPVGQRLGNSWRIGPDDSNWHGILTNIDIMHGLEQYAGPGGFNDPCLLLSTDLNGKFIVTELQSRAQMSMWAVLAAPLLISGNVRNTTAMNLETYSNKEVIAVSQDVLGKQGIRVAGGPLSGGSGFVTPGVATCDASDPHQQWDANTPMAGFLQTQDSTKKCLNVNDCGTQLIMFDCVTSGGTCAGSDNYSNEQFVQQADGTLVNTLTKHCVTASGVGVVLAPCTGSATQTWKYDSTTKQYSLASGSGGGRCLTSSGSGPSGTNVWARPLSNGAQAVVFLNVGSTATDVSCDVSCFSNMGFKTGDVLAVRDLWAHKDMPSYTVGSSSTGFKVPSLPSSGGVAMFTFTKSG